MRTVKTILAVSALALAFGAPSVAFADHHENPCAGKKVENPCSEKAENPCSKKAENPCSEKAENPCAAKKGDNPCGEKK